jgi:predicted molibdopterin-dependent oxidoreductase YjgC
MRGLPTACTTPATDGMVVHTDTLAVNEVRRTVIDLIIADHPMDCLTCPKNQQCDLQKVAAYIGINERRLPNLSRSLSIDTSNPFFYLDRNYCILCGKCVRTCDEVTMVNAIEMVDRGFPSRVSPFSDRPLLESICQSCGECVVRCPVNALMPKNPLLPIRDVKTICPYCGVGCGMQLDIREDRIVSVRGERENPANKGRLCVKGRFGIAEFVHHPERLATPKIRRNGELTDANWEEALKLVADKLGYYKGQVAVISSARATNEDNYIIQKFTRKVLGTNSIDHCARL